MRSSITVFKREYTHVQMSNIVPHGYIAILQPSSQFVYTWFYRYYIRSCPLNKCQTCSRILVHPWRKIVTDFCPKQFMLLVAFSNTNARLSLPKVKGSLWHGGHFAHYSKSTTVPMSL